MPLFSVKSNSFVFFYLFWLFVKFSLLLLDRCFAPQICRMYMYSEDHKLRRWFEIFVCVTRHPRLFILSNSAAQCRSALLNIICYMNEELLFSNLVVLRSLRQIMWKPALKVQYRPVGKVLHAQRCTDTGDCILGLMTEQGLLGTTRKNSIKNGNDFQSPQNSKLYK